MKKIRLVVLSSLAAAWFSLTTFAYTPYQCYTYSTVTGTAETVYSPAPYIPGEWIDTSTLGTPLVQPVDLQFDSKGNLFVVDAGQNELLEINPSYQVVKTLKSFAYGGSVQTFSGPQGVYVNDTRIYLCDTGNRRIVVFDRDYHCVGVLGTPQSPILGKSYQFKPRKLAVDGSGTLFVLNTNEYNGVMKLTSQGSFLSFIGSNTAAVNLADAFWKKIMTKAQRSQLTQNIPADYYNISEDPEGFLYVVSQVSSEPKPVKRLNLSGSDVLVRDGYVDIIGDVVSNNGKSTDEADQNSVFCDVAADRNGFYFVLDSNRCRIFEYDSEGYLYCVFSGKGDRFGQFRAPTAIEQCGGRLYVADGEKGSITVFKPTAYGSLLMQAKSAYDHGQYQKSVSLWKQVIHNNVNFDLAYAEIGKVVLRERKYKEAMRYFELGNYRGDAATGLTGYNKAFIEYRKIATSKYLGKSLLTIAAICVGLWVWHRLRKKRRRTTG